MTLKEYQECIKMLGFRRNGECLGGLYLNKACEIRDIWGGNPT